MPNTNDRFTGVEENRSADVRGSQKGSPAERKAMKAKKTKAVAVELVRQPHGGAIAKGGIPGNKGGLGRVPSLLRDRLSDSFAERYKVLEEIADGTPVEEVRLELAEILPHVECPECGGSLSAKSGIGEVLIRATRTARPNDRIKAVDTLGKYGPGQRIENEFTLVHPDVQERLQKTVNLVFANAPQLVDDLERIWNS